MHAHGRKYVSTSTCKFIHTPLAQWHTHVPHNYALTRTHDWVMNTPYKVHQNYDQRFVGMFFSLTYVSYSYDQLAPFPERECSRFHWKEVILNWRIPLPFPKVACFLCEWWLAIRGLPLQFRRHANCIFRGRWVCPSWLHRKCFTCKKRLHRSHWRSSNPGCSWRRCKLTWLRWEVWRRRWDLVKKK